ncbi:MAG: hydrogenase expression protein [Anaerolineae bacterium]|nr:hydrogenase expression protein [Anaerolineae bacterium]
MANPLPVGKLPAELLQELLRKYTRPNSRVIVGPGVGEDAAVIDFGERYLVAKTDPITFATDEIGWYAVNVNANDIACSGGVPKWFLVTALLPAGTADAEMAESIFAQLAEACQALDITLCGGHTEVTYDLDRPILVGLMLGEVEPARLVHSGGARPGDALILTKGIAIEGTALIAREKGEMLAGEFPADFLRRCRQMLHEPGISVVREARLLRQHVDVHAMHDPTEGGLATALWELAAAAGVGLRVYRDAIPILAETQALCQRFGLDPLGLIASGALLATVPAVQAEEAVRVLAEAGIVARCIGEVLPAGEGVWLRDAGGDQPLPRFPRDEFARLVE